MDKPPLTTAVLTIAAASFGVSVALAQSSGQPAPNFANPPHKNVKIYPADLPRAQLLANMRLFSQSLGVRCTYCHVGQEGQPLSTFDFATDAKPPKAVARRMLLMTRAINQQHFGVTDFANVKVTCFTCHRGSTKPLAMPPDAPVPVAPPAAPPKTERG
ncbi:MAG TPA: c-type cytochrome [Sphingomicrobium sp.]|nr:c-type cytochrome [Sphingomicrobium sp.]